MDLEKLMEHRNVLLAMARVALDDHLPEGEMPDTLSVVAVLEIGGMTREQAYQALEAATDAGVINLGTRNLPPNQRRWFVN